MPHATPAYAAAAEANNRGVELQASGAIEEARASFNSALAFLPTSVDAHGNLAASFLHSGARHEAWSVLQQAVRIVPTATGMYSRMGTVLTAGKPLDSLPVRAKRAAASIAGAALRLAPTDSTLWCNLGLVLLAMGHGNRSERAYRRALSLAPNNADAWLGLSSTQSRQSAVETLLSALSLRLELHGSTAALYYNLGNHLHLGRYDVHISNLVASGSLSRVNPSHSISEHCNPERCGSTITMPAAATAEALRCFETATILQPQNADAYYNLGLAAQQSYLDIPFRAISAYRSALRLAPRDGKIWSRLVTALSWDGRVTEAAHVTAEALTARIWQNSTQRPAVLVPGLTARPWHDARLYHRLTAVLHKKHELLVRALAWIQLHGRMTAQPEGLQELGQDWHVFDIGQACRSVNLAANDNTVARASSSDTFPAGHATKDLIRVGGGEHPLQHVCELVSGLKEQGQTALPPFEPLKIQFSVMSPGVHVRPHSGPTNAKLTLHYGLSIPSGAAIRVGHEQRPFLQGGLLVFDDSFEHEVWQEGSVDRATLVIHVAHPDLKDGGFETLVRAIAN